MMIITLLTLLLTMIIILLFFKIEVLKDIKEKGEELFTKMGYMITSVTMISIFIIDTSGSGKSWFMFLLLMISIGRVYIIYLGMRINNNKLCK